ncbi:MAG: Uncharacterized protein Greene041679_224 [Parcubacteria group bacterium Greene0416_79]|nr:MAG: Uncharacterized protein Greene041679_224 [Parcubacteria group bacterium Greene0416_79]
MKEMRNLQVQNSVKIENGNLRIHPRGFSLVEVVIGAALILLSLIGLITAYSFYLKAGLKNTDRVKAAFLLEEGVEAVLLLRDGAWSNLSSLTGGTWYYLAWNGSSWSATTTETVVDSVFTRTFRIDEVYRRDSDKDIVASTSPAAKSVDQNTKRVTVRVATDEGVTGELATYLTNLFE